MPHSKPTIEDLAQLLPEREGWMALSYVMNQKPGWLFARRQTTLPDEKIAQYLAIVRKRQTGLPLQYAIGRWDFYGRTFLCDQRALIPRPETERLIEIALEKHIAGTIADIGTGTGCIILTLLMELENIPPRGISDRRLDPNSSSQSATDHRSGSAILSQSTTNHRSGAAALSQSTTNHRLGAVISPHSATNPDPSAATLKNRYLATDISAPALDLARENERLITGSASAMVQWLHGNLLDPLDQKVDWILSNPPYVAESDRQNLQKELSYEPENSLFAGPDGLDLYRTLIPALPGKLKAGGQILLEIGDQQGPVIAGLLAQAGLSEIHIYQDYAGRDRVAYACCCSSTRTKNQ